MTNIHKQHEINNVIFNISFINKLFNMNFLRDVSIIFLLFVIGDIFTTWINISSGTGIESNNLFVDLVNGGIYGFLLFFMIKSIVFVFMILSMKVTINLDLPKSYFLIRNTISTVSSVIIISNLLVYFVGISIFETILVW